MDTDAGNPGIPVRVIAFDVAGLPDMHCKEEFRMQVTTSPETGL